MVQGAGVKVIGGTLSGGISVAVNEWACKHKTLYMAYCHTSMPLGSEFCGYGFVSGMIPYQTGTAMAKYAFENLGKTWMILTQDYRYGYDQFQAFLGNSEKYGGEFKGHAYIPLGTVDFTVHIPKIAAIKPDILVLNIYGQSLSAAIKQLAEMGLTKSGMKFVIPKSHLTTILEAGPLYNENFYGAHTFYWQMQDKYPNAKKFVESYWKKFGQPPSQDSDGGYTGTRALFEAMNKAGTTTDVDKLIKTLEGYSYQYNKGPESFRACDHIRQTSVAILKGKGDKADFEKWDLADFIGEIPAKDTLESCENNAKDLPLCENQASWQVINQLRLGSNFPSLFSYSRETDDMFELNLNLIIMQAFFGLALGTVYILMACGLTIIFGLLDVVNFAHGTFYMLGAFAAFVIISLFGNFWLGLVAAVVIVGIVGALTESLLLKRLYGKDPLYPLLLTFGFSVAVVDLMRVIFGTIGKVVPYPKMLMSPLIVGGYSFQNIDFLLSC